MRLRDRWHHAAAVVLTVAASGCATASGERAAWPRPAGSAAWDAVARRALARHDADGSGLLEAGEVGAIGCDVWRGLDEDVVRDTGSGLVVVYGIGPGLLWRGGALGLADSARAELAGRVEACVDPHGAAEREEERALRALAELGDEPATTAWDAAVRGIVRVAWDQDGSGWLDSATEIEAVPCELWQRLDEAILSARGQPLMVLYGFSDGYAWVGDTLGVAPSMQPVAERAMTACGLAGD